MKEFHTPTLVIHGELDFRVPYTQGLQLFTALQMQKVPSKLLVFPDEGHWVLKPQNSVLWYKTFIDWIDSWVKKVKAIIIAGSPVVIGIVALFVMSGHTALSLNPAVKTVGVSTPVTVKVDQSARRAPRDRVPRTERRAYPLFEPSLAGHRLFWRRHEPPRTITFDAGKNKAPNLKEGKARIVVEAVSNDLRGSTDTSAGDVNVVLAPPRVIADDAQHYINQGGMELVTVHPQRVVDEAGVKVGKYTFRSFPLPGRPRAAVRHVRLSLGSAAGRHAAWCSRATRAGTEATAQFWFKLFPKKFRVRDFRSTTR